MHHRHRSEPAPEPTPSRPDKNSKGTHHSQLWAGLIIVAIILIALIPIVSSKLHSLILITWLKRVLKFQRVLLSLINLRVKSLSVVLRRRVSLRVV